MQASPGRARLVCIRHAPTHGAGLCIHRSDIATELSATEAFARIGKERVGRGLRFGPLLSVDAENRPSFWPRPSGSR